MGGAGFLEEALAGGALEAVPFGNVRAYIVGAQDAGLSANAAYDARADFGIALRRSTFLTQWGELRAASADREALQAVDWSVLPSDDVISDLTMKSPGRFYYDFELQLRVPGTMTPDNPLGQRYTDRIWLRSGSLISYGEAWARIQDSYDSSTAEEGTPTDTLIGGRPLNVFRGVAEEG